jgi:Undecaprenyl-phosphate galactose phosphotransferase WbaP
MRLEPRLSWACHLETALVSPLKVGEPDPSTPTRPGRSADRRLPARAARIALLGASDTAALLLAGIAAYALWALPARRQSLALYLEIAPLISVFLAGYAQAGLYPGFGVGPVETLRRLTYATTFGFLVLAAISFALKVPPLYSRVTFTLAFAFSLLLVPVARALVAHRARRWTWWAEPVVVIGTGERAARVIRSIRQARHVGYRPVAALAFGPPGEPAPDVDVEGVPIVGGIDRTPALAAEGIRVALLESRRADPGRDRPMIDRLQRDFRHVVLLREYDDLPVEGLQVRNLGGLVGIEYTNNLLRKGNQAIKRMLDLVLATLALIAAGPVIALAAALVRLLDGGPAFFVQNRAGLDGRRIAVPKIRTMRRDAEERLEEYLAASPELRREWDDHFKLRTDPRLIPLVGGIFRRYSIDELPQLWTVLRGDMSLVGPRPFPDYHLEHFPPAFLELRLRVRPGITGLWQITVRSAGSTSEQESYDSYYIRNWSVWLDLYVLSRTIAAVASGRGAY